MTRSFSDSLSLFITGARLNTDPSAFFVLPLQGCPCQRPDCRYPNNYVTDLLCRKCNRAPIPVNRLHWIHITLFVLASQWLSSHDVSLSGVPLALILFFWFSFWFTLYLEIFVFKSYQRAASANTLPSFLYARLVLWISIAFVVGLSLTHIVTPIFAFTLLASAAFVFGLLQGSRFFCTINDLSFLIPFFIVLPVNALLISIALTLLAPIIAVQLPLPSGTPSPLLDILTLSEISVSVRLYILGTYMLIMVTTYGCMEAIKAPVPGDADTLTFWYIKTKLAINNSWAILRPIWQTWHTVTRYSLIRFLLPITYPATLYLFYILIARHRQFFQWSELFLILIALGLLFLTVPLFVHSACGYYLPTFTKVTFNNMTKAHENILLWTVLWVLVGSFAFNGTRLDYAKLTIGVLTLLTLILFILKHRTSLLRHILPRIR